MDMNTIVESLNSAGFWFVRFAFPMLLQSCVLIAVLLLLDRVLRKKARAIVRYCLWMLLLLKLVLPVTLSAPTGIGYWIGGSFLNPVMDAPSAALPVAPQPEVETWELASPLVLPSPQTDLTSKFAPIDWQRPIALQDTAPTSAGPVAATMPETTIAAAPAATEPPKDKGPCIAWQGVVFAVWVAVALGMLMLIIQRSIFVTGLIRQAKDAGDKLTGLLEKCKSRPGINVRCNVRLKLSPNATSPAVCGLFRPVILIPQDLPQKLNPRYLEAVLVHELAHVKRGDLWVNMIQAMLQIFYFYNPLLWIANAAIRRVREQAVDEAVLVAMGTQADEYPETLLSVATLSLARPALSLRLIGVVESKSALTERIKHILTRPIPKSARLGAIGLITLLISAAVLLPMGQAAEKPITDQFEAMAIANLHDEESQTAAPSFKVKLPSGVVVELVGVSKLHSKNTQWWAPNGNVLKKAPCVGMQNSSQQYQYELMIKSDAPEDASNSWIPLGAETFIATTPPGDLDGNLIAGASLISLGFAKPQEEMRVRYGIAAGKWKPMIMCTTAGKSNYLRNQDVGDIVLSPPRDDNGVTSINLATKTIDPMTARRLVAIKKSGGIVKLASAKIHTNETVSGDGIQLQTYTFNQPLSEIDRFEFQTRPYEWVEFKNVSLQPGHKTHMKVTVDDETKNSTRPRGNCSIRGKVVSAETGEPVPRVRVYLFYSVTLEPLFLYAEDDGSFELENIPAGPFSLRATRTTKYQGISYDPNGKGGLFPQFSLKEGEQRTNVVLKMKPAFRISGKILDENGKMPADIDNFRVVAYAQKENSDDYEVLAINKSIVDTTDGSWEINGLDGRPVYAMAINATAAKQGEPCPPIYYPGAFSRKQATRITFDDKIRSVENLDIKLKKEGGVVLEGIVTDQTGQPIPEAFVVVHSRDLIFDFTTAYTDKTGHYKIQGLGEGEFQIQVDAGHRGFVRTRRPFDIDSKTPKVQLDVKLQPGATISGKFIDADGNDWAIANSHGSAYLKDNQDPDLWGTGGVQTGFHSKYQPKDVTGDDHGSGFVLGTGDYGRADMLFPTKSTFLLQGLAPGKTKLNFYPKKEKLKVLDIFYDGKSVMTDNLDVKRGEEIKDVVIQVGKVGQKPSAAPKPAPAAAAESAAKSWLELVDAQKYGESWDTAAALLQKMVTKKKWQDVMKIVRSDFGQVQSRKLISKQSADSLPDLPKGRYYFLRYDTKFEKKRIIENLVAQLEQTSGKWRIVGYTIAPYTKELANGATSSDTGKNTELAPPRANAEQKAVAQIAGRFVKAVMADDKKIAQSLIVATPPNDAARKKAIERIWEKIPEIRNRYKGHGDFLKKAQPTIVGRQAFVTYPCPGSSEIVLAVAMFHGGKNWKVLDLAITKLKDISIHEAIHLGPEASGISTSTVTAMYTAVNSNLPQLQKIKSPETTGKTPLAKGEFYVTGGDHSSPVPKIVGCRVERALDMPLNPITQSKIPQKQSVFETDLLKFKWSLDPKITKQASYFAVVVVPKTAKNKINDMASHSWSVVGIPAGTRSGTYGQVWPDTINQPAKVLSPGDYTVYCLAYAGPFVRGADRQPIAGAQIDLTVEPLPSTQIMINDIQPDGSINFKSVIQYTNTYGRTLKTIGFQNSDFVHVKQMTAAAGKPLEFTSKHVGRSFRYKVTLNKPVAPGKPVSYSSSGTISKLISQTAPGKFRYRMKHYPSTGKPTRRIEIHRLPPGAKLLQITPKSLTHRVANGRIEIFVDKIIKPGGSLAVSYNYALSLPPTVAPKGSTLEFRIAPSRFAMNKAGLDKDKLARYQRLLAVGQVGFVANAVGQKPSYGWLLITDDLGDGLVTAEHKGQKYVLVSDKLGEKMLHGKGKKTWGLMKVYANTDQYARPGVAVVFDEKGSKLLTKLTKANLENAVAIIVDGKVLSVPVIQSVISDRAAITGKFSKQQVDALVKALKIGMPAVGPPVKKTSFGPVIERVVNYTGQNCMIDFDTDKLITPPKNVFEGGSEGFNKWIGAHGIDAGGNTQPAVSGLVGSDMIALPQPNDVWKKMTPDGLSNYDKAAFKFCKPGSPIYLTAKGGVPVTYVFKTREGGVGILQILEIKTAEPKSVKIHYKMLRPPQTGDKPSTMPTTKPAGKH